MADFNFNDSAYTFNESIRYFKANDPYYFEVDNIPLKQLQENCNWLKDQLNLVNVFSGITEVKRADFQELRPYATGGDRVVRVKPGRYTARINDASNRQPLSFLNKVAGDEVAQSDSYGVTIPQTNTVEGQNLLDALDTFKSSLAENALQLNGLETRLFTWPIYTPDFPVGVSGVDLDPDVNYIKYKYSGGNGDRVNNLAAVISQALLWVVGLDQPPNSFLVEALINNSTAGPGGMSLLPRLEANFIKYWRGVARTAVVDVPTELSIEVPPFDSNDFNYIDELGNEVSVDGIQSRIDLIFIYSKPVDTSSVSILKPSGKEVITTPKLGIVRGAGIKNVFERSQSLLENVQDGIKQFVTDEHKILASPGDSFNENLGFTAASGNDIAFDVRGSFPSPDDILNLAPLISEKLEDSAIELVGQSILPVAYVWVKKEGSQLTNSSVAVLPTDVIDIRPIFRTTELAYNERAGIAAAMPQLSLANPAVGKAQMDFEHVRLYNEIINNYEQELLDQLLESVSFQAQKKVILEEPYLIYNGNKDNGDSFFPAYQGRVPSLQQGVYYLNSQTTNATIFDKFGTSANPIKWTIPDDVLVAGDSPENVLSIDLNISVIERQIENSVQFIYAYSEENTVPTDLPFSQWHKIALFGCSLQTAGLNAYVNNMSYTLPVQASTETNQSGVDIPVLNFYTASDYIADDPEFIVEGNGYSSVYIEVVGYTVNRPAFS